MGKRRGNLGTTDGTGTGEFLGDDLCLGSRVPERGYLIIVGYDPMIPIGLSFIIPKGSYFEGSVRPQV